jgi:MoxR-like ATPase
VGKTAVVDEFAARLGYDVQPVLVHKDMTARDLLQQRGTRENGDTYWKKTPLVNAALQGSLAVLDGVHRADPSTIGVLQRLAQDREATLNDGTVLLKASRYDAIKEMQGFSDGTVRVFRQKITLEDAIGSFLTSSHL